MRPEPSCGPSRRWKRDLALTEDHAQTDQRTLADIPRPFFQSVHWWIFANQREAPGISAKEDAVPEALLDQITLVEGGDLWPLCKVRIILGNSLHEDIHQTAMGIRCAAAVFTDSSFNMKIGSHAAHARIAISEQRP
jgi:hypothetical protein